MTDESPKRRWWQLHWLTWVAVLVVAASLAVKNLDGTVRTRPLVHAWFVLHHGWPKTFLTRDEMALMSRPPSSRWLFDDFFWSEFSASWLVFDIVVALVILVGTTFCIEIRCRRRPTIPIRFNLKGLFVLTGLAGTCLLLFGSAGDVWVNHINDVSTAVILAGVVCTWLAFFDLIGYLFNWLTRSQK